MLNRRIMLKRVAMAAGLTAFQPYSSAAVNESDIGFVAPPNATDCHVHIFDPARFPYSSSRKYTPPPATLADLHALHDSMGIQRVVLVQPSVYGTDNRCLLASLAELGRQARGVAVISRETTPSELAELVAAGVRGVRINLEVGHDRSVSSAIQKIQQTAEQIDPSQFFIQVYSSLPVIAACAPAMNELPHRFVIDHFGLAKVAGGTTQDGFKDVLRLLRNPRIFMKLSGPYQISDQKPGYRDTAAVGKAFVEEAPHQLVWGSDWPHTGGTNRPKDAKPTDIEPFRAEDDRQNFGLIAIWASTQKLRQQLLVDNPAHLYGF